VKATKEGVVRFPWSLAIISILSSLKIPTQEYVVPRSIPIAGPPMLAKTESLVSGAGGYLPIAGAMVGYVEKNLRDVWLILDVLCFKGS
jgi:hypothetical protein